MSDESHRDAMNHAIRAQRERGNVPRSMLPPEDDPASTPVILEPPVTETEREPAKKGFFARLLGRY